MIYVDELKPCPPIDASGGRWRFKHYCHMAALYQFPNPSRNTLENQFDLLHKLHSVARDLGLKMEYFQNVPGFPHYDLTKTKRGLVLKKFSCLQISCREMVVRCDDIYGPSDSWLKRKKVKE